MRLTDEAVRRVRRVYAEGDLGSRRIDALFGYTGSQGVLRTRRRVDPAYVPPARKPPGSRPVPVVIDGEAKSVDEWAADPRCEVAARTIRQRLADGVTGADLLLRRSRAG